MVDVNTIIGEPVITGSDTVIIPVSKVCLGFLSGGGEYSEKPCKRAQRGEQQERTGDYPFAGTSAAGMNLTPMAFLAITNGVVRVLPANYRCTVDRIIEMVPEAVRELEHLVGRVCEKKPVEKKPDENAGAQAQQ